ncbi:MAG: hypothetical protein Q9169_005967 [Polycauliona sp. 2 TL-2023]
MACQLANGLAEIIDNTSPAQLNKILDETQDITTALYLGRNLILSNIRTDEHVQSNCGRNIFAIWTHFNQLKESQPQYTSQIEHWCKQVRQEAPVKRYLLVGEKTQRRIDICTERILDNWEVTPTDLLPEGYRDLQQRPSRDALELISSMSQLVTLEEGRQLLIEAMEERQTGKAGNSNTAIKRLKLSDVQKSLKKAKQLDTKRKYLRSYNPGVSKRQKRSARSPSVENTRGRIASPSPSVQLFDDIMQQSVSPSSQSSGHITEQSLLRTPQPFNDIIEQDSFDEGLLFPPTATSSPILLDLPHAVTDIPHREAPPRPDFQK